MYESLSWETLIEVIQFKGSQLQKEVNIKKQHSENICAEILRSYAGNKLLG
jgi:hypothetical protein